MKKYQHTQRGAVIIVSLLVLAAVLAVVGLCCGRQFFISLPFLLLSVWLFHSLTIELTGDELRWYFGPGLISNHVPLAEIASSRIVRTGFPEGWGIHWSRFGWLYNVSGRDAVAVVLRNGKKFALGTDEPETLCAALRTNAGQ